MENIEKKVEREEVKIDHVAIANKDLISNLIKSNT